MARLQYATETALERHGKLIVEKQLELRRLADAAIDIYAMTGWCLPSFYGVSLWRHRMWPRFLRVTCLYLVI